MKRIVTSFLTIFAFSASQASIVTGPWNPNDAAPSKVSVSVVTSPDASDHTKTLYQPASENATEFPNGISRAVSTGSGFSTGQAYAYAKAGVLKTAVNAATSVRDSVGSQSIATASWDATFAFTDAHLTGTAGRVTLKHYYDYVLDQLVSPVSPSGPRNSSFSFGVFQADFKVQTSKGTFESQHQVRQTAWNEPNYRTEYNFYRADALGWTSVDKPGNQDLVIDFVWGEPIYLKVSLMNRCQAWTWDENGFSSCSIDATKSSYWNGFSDVMSDGALITDFTTVGNVDVNFSQSLIPVPEPSTAMMIPFALLVVVFSARRRQELRT